MKKTDLSQKALAASFQLHKELLNDCCYAGYDGDKEAFDNLYNEVYVICRDELPDDATVKYVCETFHDYQFEQMNGDREIGWWM
jgi:hypothetical protein